jgi:hypothetical protein
MKVLRPRWSCVKWVLWCALISATAVAAAPRTVLDRSTGATIGLSAKPWVFALDQPHLAAHARDYIALYAMEINIGGKRRHHLAAFFWSTVHGRQHFAGAAPVLRIQVDDRDLRLNSQGRSPRDFGVGQWPLKSPQRTALLMIYEVDEALLRQLGTAQQLQLRPETDTTLPEDVWFAEWRSGRREFQAFVLRLLQP